MALVISWRMAPGDHVAGHAAYDVRTGGFLRVAGGVGSRLVGSSSQQAPALGRQWPVA